MARKKKPHPNPEPDPELRIPKTPRMKGVPRPWESAFLAHLAQTYNVEASCKKAKISKTEAYRKRREDPKFAEDWDRAREIGAAALESEAIRRAVEGWLEPIYHDGEIVGYVRKYSDRLIEFLLRGAMPEKYRERHELSGRVDGNLTLTPGQTATLDAIYGDAAEETDGAERDGAGDPEPV